MVEQHGALGQRPDPEGDLYEALRQAYMLILPSASDVAAFGTFDQPRATRLLQRAERQGLLVSIKVGQTFALQSRYASTARGVREMGDKFGLPVRRHHCEEGLQRPLQRLRQIEVANRPVPRLMTSGAVQVPIELPLDLGDDLDVIELDESAVLEDAMWLEAGRYVPLHGILTYRARTGRKVIIFLVFVGLHHKSGLRANDDFKTLPDLCAELEVVPGFLEDVVPARPSGVVFITIDRLAGWQVQRSFPRLPKAIVDADGNIIEKLAPVPPLGTIRPVQDHQGLVGQPERAIRRMCMDSKLMAVQGVPARKVVEFIEGNPDCNASIIAEGVGQPRSALIRRGDDYHGDRPARPEDSGAGVKKRNAILTLLLDAQIAVETDGGYLLAKEGRQAAARRDRRTAQTVHRQQQALTNEDGRYRKMQRRHQRDVAKLRNRLRKVGLAVYEGWRVEMHYGEITLRPDLWVLIPAGDGVERWHAVELERSAFAPSKVRERLNNYYGALEADGGVPSLWVVGKGEGGETGRDRDETAVSKFLHEGNRLNALVMSNREALGGQLDLLLTGWRRSQDPDQVCPIDSLVFGRARRDTLVQMPGKVVGGFRKRVPKFAKRTCICRSATGTSIHLRRTLTCQHRGTGSRWTSGKSLRQRLRQAPCS